MDPGLKEFMRKPLVKAIALSAAFHLAILLAVEGQQLLKPPKEVILQVSLVPTPPPKHKKRTVKRKAKKRTSKKATVKKSRPRRKRVAVAKLRKKIREDPEQRRLRAIKEIEKRVKEREERVQKGVLDIYLAQLRERIRAFWAIPDVLLKEGVKAVIRVKIDEQGRLLLAKVEESSGDPNFDRSVLQALYKAEPFPPPPGGKPMEVGLVFRP